MTNVRFEEKRDKNVPLKKNMINVRFEEKRDKKCAFEEKHDKCAF